MMNKLTLSQLFDKKDVTDTTKKLYIRQLTFLNNNKPPKGYSFLLDIDKIKEKINDFKPTTKRSYYVAIASYLSVLPDNKKKNDLHKKYISILMQFNKELSERKDMRNDEVKNWITKEDINKIFDDKYSIIDKLKNRLTLRQDEYNKLTELVILSLYVLTIPRRILDYTNMYVVKKTPQEYDGKNYLVLNDKKFVFTDYKTRRKHGVQIIGIPEKLFNILNKYIKVNSKRIDDRPLKLLYRWDKVPVLGNNVTRILNKIFGKKISVNILRKVFATNEFSGYEDKIKEASQMMGTSIDTLNSHYIKKVKLD